MEQDKKDFQTKDEVLKKPQTPFGLQVFFGFIAYVVSVACCFPFGLSAIIIAIVLLIMAAIFLYERYRWKGFIVGILIGLGLTALVVGLCFVAVVAAFSHR